MEYIFGLKDGRYFSFVITKVRGCLPGSIYKVCPPWRRVRKHSFNHFNVMPQLNILSLALTHVFHCINHSSSAGFCDLNQKIISKNYVNEFSVLPWLSVDLMRRVCYLWRNMSSVSGGDVRKDFLLATIANYFGIPLRHESVARLAESPQLNNFLDDGNSSLLSANLDPGEDIPLFV